MATPISRVTVLLLLLLFAIWRESSHAVAGDTTNRRTFSVSGSDRSLLRNNRIPNCREMALKSQCSQTPKCRWCRSELLDDMCFPKTEALRLPTQVFSCD